MKRFRNLVIGGIENKLFNLILLTLIAITAAFIAVSAYQANMLSKLAQESAEKQQVSIEETTSMIMDQVVVKSLERNNRTAADISSAMFLEAQERVTFLSDYAAKLFAEPERYSEGAYAGPNPDQDGLWTAKVIYADGVNPADPEVASRTGLIANMSGMMISLCPSMRASTVYVALPEGVHLSVSDNSSSWFENGRIKSYDPRSRGWYQQAAEAGHVIFTEGELDANTGIYCIECAAPVYGPDGSLRAVVGTDLYLDEMQKVMQSSLSEGEFCLLVNREGKAVLPAQELVFPIPEEERGSDLRSSSLEMLAKAVKSAVEGTSSGVLKGELQGGEYYLAAAEIESTGWVMLSAFKAEIAGRPAALMLENYKHIQQETSETYYQNTSHSKATAIVLVITAGLLMLTGAVILGKRIVKPLNTITRRISELREGNLEFRMEDAYRTGDEIQELAESFAVLSRRTVDYMDTVQRVTAEKERIGTELALATQIQAAMLPHLFPAFPDRKDFDIFASMDPAKEVGGDFYDYFLIDEDHLGMVIADVSGKGVPAALFMMASKIILQSVAMMGYSPAEVLARTNEAICSNNEAEMFVTVWIGILELSTGLLTAANAGHEYPALMHPNGKFELFRDQHGFVIGGMEGVKYRIYEIQLEPGAKLFVYTDGVPEATNPEKELFGTERMIAALNRDTAASPMQTLANVRAAVDDFVQNAEQFDDMTMLCMEFKGRN